MRSFLIQIVLFAAAWLSAAQAEPLPDNIGNWRFSTSTDVMTDESTVFAVNSSAAPADQDSPRSIMISCDQPTLRVFILTDGFWYSDLPHQLIAVTYRVDRASASRGTWYLNRGGKSAHVLSSDLLSAMRHGSYARFEVSSYRSSHLAMFDIHGTDEVLIRLNALCAAGQKRATTRDR